MDIQSHLLELEIAVQRITDGLNAIYHYLSEAEHMLKAQLTACLDRT